MTATLSTLDCLSFHSMTSVIQCDFFINILQIKTQHLPLSSLYVNQHLQLYCGVISLTRDHSICFLYSTGIYNNNTIVQCADPKLSYHLTRIFMTCSFVINKTPSISLLKRENTVQKTRSHSIFVSI